MLNSVHLIGHLGKDPVINTSNGVNYARFSVANNRTWTDRSGERKEAVTWIDVVAFNGLAKSLEQLASGDQVAVSGRLQNKSDREGRIRGLEIVADEIDFLKVKAWQQRNL